MALELNKGTLLAIHLGRMKERGTLRPEHVSVGKLNNTREAHRDRADRRADPRRQRHHARVPVMRHMTNLESVLTYEGTEEIHTLVVGQALTGERAFA